MAAGVPATTEQRLDARTRPAEASLVRSEGGGAVRCLACGHRCLVRPGSRGICKVRSNHGGTLRVPRGYVAALALDPVEKKPFFHALPGSGALSFGMLGCDFHCGYCFPGDTVVLSDEGPSTLAGLFASCARTELRPDAEVAFPDGRKVVTASGSLRRVAGVVRHRYRGPLVVLEPLYLPPLRCTPDHRIHATADPRVAPAPVPARDLDTKHYLAVPRRLAGQGPTTLDVAALLRRQQVTYRVHWRLRPEVRERILTDSAKAVTSRAIGTALGMEPSQVRHFRSKVAKGLGENTRTRGPVEAAGKVRFPGEHGDGIPATLPLDADLAALLGYYCAEGCVVRGRKRPNSHVLNFSFSRQETGLAGRVSALLKGCLGVDARLVERETTLGVSVGKASAALLFKSLAGGRSSEKRVPAVVAAASRDVMTAFLDAYAEGDGHRYAGGKVSVTTVSSSLAYGVAWLALRAGWLPSVYRYETGGSGRVLGREVRCAPYQYSVVWYTEAPHARRMVETDDHYLVPLRAIRVEPFDGHVYNMEVEEEHSYLAGFFAVSNCQNWVTSQTLRDPASTDDLRDLEARDLVAMAREAGAPILVSTYNEPLITAEWAAEVFDLARAEGLLTGFVSNGNGTPEALAFLRPRTDLYKVDLKGFRDETYRRLGGSLRNVLETVERLKAEGFWLEIVTLLVPGLNDSEEEVRGLVRFVAGVSPDIPWHVTAFHPDYRMTDRGGTTAAMLLRAADLGREAGLRYVYPGNMPGRVGDGEDTRCPSCRATLIRRVGFRVLEDRLTPTGGTCPGCGTSIPGVWRRPSA